MQETSRQFSIKELCTNTRVTDLIYILSDYTYNYISIFRNRFYNFLGKLTILKISLLFFSDQFCCYLKCYFSWVIMLFFKPLCAKNTYHDSCNWFENLPTYTNSHGFQDYAGFCVIFVPTENMPCYLRSFPINTYTAATQMQFYLNASFPNLISYSTV